MRFELFRFGIKTWILLLFWLLFLLFFLGLYFFDPSLIYRMQQTTYQNTPYVNNP